MTTTKIVEAIVVGHVQGVGFRAFVRLYATQLGITGFAENQRDGTVLVRLEGDGKAIDDMIDLLKEGPARARVEKVHVQELNNSLDMNSFEMNRPKNSSWNSLPNQD